MTLCKNDGGQAIGAGHSCSCLEEENHEGKHGCECGALWDGGIPWLHKDWTEEDLRKVFPGIIIL